MIGGASRAVNVAENATAVTTVAATDADGDAVTYAINSAPASFVIRKT
jgi:hypothetical protein